MTWTSTPRRLLGVALLLLVEALLLTLRFDSAPLADLHGWSAWPLHRVSEVPRFALAVGTVLLLGGREHGDLLARSATEPAPRRAFRFLVAHAVALVAFVWLTARVLEGPRAEAERWVLPWLSAGVVSVLVLGPLVARPGVLLGLARSSWRLLALSFAAGLAAWAAGLSSRALAGPLQRLTSRAVFAFVGVFRADAFHDAEAFVVGTPRFEVEIAPACSGYEGIGLIVVFQLVFLWTHRRELRFPAALSLVPLGAALAAIANVARLGVLVLVGELSPAVARGGFHSHAGAVLFSCVALGMAAAGLRLPGLRSNAARDEGGSVEAPSRWTRADALLLPFIASLAVHMVTGLFSAGVVDALYGLRVAAAALVLWLLRAHYEARWRPVAWSAPAIGLAVGVTWLVLTPAPEERSLMLVEAARQAPPALVAGWLVTRALGSVVVVPVIEELAFRGYVMRRLASRDFDAVGFRETPLWPIALSSALFGLMHTQQVLAGTLAGAAFALASRRRGRLEDAIVAHATSNATLLVYAVATGRWSAWL